MPVLFKEISIDLNLNLVSIGTIWGMDPLAGVFVGLIGGLLVDRFGVKRTLTVVSILAGVFSASRGFSTNFSTMASSMFLFGIMSAMIPSIVPKTAAIWFDSKQMGLANALLYTAGSIGSMVATMTSATLLSPLLGGWRNVLFLFGAPSVLVGILWLVTGRESPRADNETSRPDSQSEIPAIPAKPLLRQAFSQVIRIKEVWVIGLIALTLWGATMGFVGYLPLYLRNIGWNLASADGVITAYNGAALAGVIPMTLLAKSLQNYKGMLFLSMLATVGLTVLTPLFGNAAVWPVIIIGSFIRSVAFSVIPVLLFDLKGVGSIYGGTAQGLVTSLGMIGAFAAPPLGNSMSVFSQQAPFFFWGGLAIVSLPLFLFLRQHKQ
jgi:sugar phosphate permease